MCLGLKMSTPRLPDPNPETGQIDNLPPAPQREAGRYWRWVLIWWACLVTVLTLTVPAVVLLVAFGKATLPDAMFIAYVSAATGGNTLLAFPGRHLLSPFSRLQ